MTKTAVAGLLAVLALAGCGASAAGSAPGEPVEGLDERSIRVTATTNLVADLAQVVGGDRVEVTALMGPGVDPHLYKASAGDVSRLEDADVIFYGGLELEGRMADLLDELGETRTTVAVTRDIPHSRLLRAPGYADKFDPHVWFDVALWKLAAEAVADTYATLDPGHASVYERNLDAYLEELDELEAYVARRVEEVPERSRVLVTSHDAFHYFGRATGFRVEAIQGISTQTEATTGDVDRVAALIAERRLKAVFVESSVPAQTIEAVLAAARNRGWDARIGGSLFSDAAGAAGTVEGTYLGMSRHNVDTIVEALR